MVERLELKTVAASSRGSAGRKPDAEVKGQAGTSLSLGALVLTGALLMKKLLWSGSPVAAEAADDHVPPGEMAKHAGNDGIARAPIAPDDPEQEPVRHGERSDVDEGKGPVGRPKAFASHSSDWSVEDYLAMDAPLDLRSFRISAHNDNGLAGAIPANHGTPFEDAIRPAGAVHALAGAAPASAAPSAQGQAKATGAGPSVEDDQAEQTGGEAASEQQSGNTAPSGGRNNRAPVVTRSVVLPDLIVNHALLLTLGDLLHYASDPDGDALGITGIEASSGTLHAHGDGTWTFTPNVDDSEGVVLSYLVTDGEISVAQTAVIDLVPALSADGESISGDDRADTLVGTDFGDDIHGGGGNDLVYAKAGDDIIDGGTGDDTLIGGDGADIIFAGAGNDTVLAGAGNDIVFGGSGNDVIFAGAGDDQIRGDSGDDILVGEGGNDLVSGGDGNDLIRAGGSGLSEAGSDGDDIYDGGAGVDTLDVSALHSDTVIDLAQGVARGTEMGTDLISGIENVIGGAGNDIIVDSAERNVLAGGQGADVFVFEHWEQPSSPVQAADRIIDFEAGDKIDVSRLDAKAGEPAKQNFVFAGLTDSNAGPGEGKLGFHFEADDEGEHTILVGQSDSEGLRDFLLDLLGHHELSADDFLGLN